MELKDILQKAKKYTKKYRYGALVLMIGLAFMFVPNLAKKGDDSAKDVMLAAQDSVKSADDLLEDILSSIDGAGKVKVLLTVLEGTRTVYQTNSNNTQISTVIVTDSERAQDGLVVQVNPPVYLGAIVVCQGADSPSVRLAVVEAVSNVTGLGADRISVLKMK